MAPGATSRAAPVVLIYAGAVYPRGERPGPRDPGLLRARDGILAPQSTSSFAILGVLSLGAMSGYDVKKLIERSIAHFWNESYGQATRS